MRKEADDRGPLAHPSLPCVTEIACRDIEKFVMMNGVRELDGCDWPLLME